MNKYKHFIKNLFVISALTAANIQGTSALPINTSETIFGSDFSHINTFEANVGTLDIGINTVSGFLDTEDAGDDFIFSLAANQVITDVSISISNFSVAEYVTGFAVIFEPVNTPPNFDNNTFPDNGVFNLFLPDPGATNYEVNFEIGPTLFSGNYNWLVTMDVTATPEPPVSILLGIGLLALIGVTRKKTA